VTEDREWYVVAKDDPDEGEGHTYVFGPFVAGGESDARAYALDLETDDDGWQTIEAIPMSQELAQTISTDGRVLWPYTEGQEDRPA
jgi:hypothetical protein